MFIVLLLIAQTNDAPTGSREVIPGGATHIVHIRDWHFVSREDFAIDTALAGDELDAKYAELIERVKAVQESQRDLLKSHKVVYVEGLAQSDMPIFKAMIGVQRKRPDDELALKIGAAGQLMAEGKIKVRPAEGEGFEKANPVKDGKVEFDVAAIEDREDAVVRKLLKQKGTVVLVLGGAHNLADNIRRLSKDCGYTVVTPGGYPE